MSDIEYHNVSGSVDEDGDAKVIGLIENKTNRPLDLEVEVTFYDGDDFIGHSSDYIDVPPGRKRPFEVTAYDMHMTRFEVEAFNR